MRVPKRIEQLLAAVLSGRGEIEHAVRRAVFEQTSHGRSSPRKAESPNELRELVDAIDESAWKIGDWQFQRLRDAGYSEDQLFEVTVAAAAGAGMRRLQAGLRAIESANEQRGGFVRAAEMPVAREREKSEERR